MTSILILYHSQEYGNTKLMAEAIAEGVEQFGGKATLFNTNDKRFVIEEFRQFDAVAFGSPDYYSYIAGGLKTFVDDLYIARKSNREGLGNKPYSLFYSHGGGGRVREHFENLFRALKVGKKIGSTIESLGAPDDTVIQVCHELGRDLVHAVEK